MSSLWETRVVNNMLLWFGTDLHQNEMLIKRWSVPICWLGTAPSWITSFALLIHTAMLKSCSVSERPASESARRCIWSVDAPQVFTLHSFNRDGKPGPLSKVKIGDSAQKGSIEVFKPLVELYCLKSKRWRVKLWKGNWICMKLTINQVKYLKGLNVDISGYMCLII